MAKCSEIDSLVATWFYVLKLKKRSAPPSSLFLLSLLYAFSERMSNPKLLSYIFPEKSPIRII
jgi:hypothetical protein